MSTGPCGFSGASQVFSATAGRDELSALAEFLPQQRVAVMQCGDSCGCCVKPFNSRLERSPSLPWAYSSINSAAAPHCRKPDYLADVLQRTVQALQRTEAAAGIPILVDAAETVLTNVVPKLRTALVHAYPTKTAADGAAQHIG
jgi:hypothetical protein